MILDAQSFKVEKFWRTDFSPDEPYQICAAVSPDAKLLATGGQDKMIRLWDFDKTDQLIRKLPGHKKSVQCLDFNSNSSVLASCSGEQACYLWKGFQSRLEMSQISTKKNNLAYFRGCKFSKHDPKVLYTWMNETLKGPSFVAKWDIDRGIVLRSIAVSNSKVTAAGNISDDGRSLILGTETAEVVIIDCATMTKLCTFRKQHK
jgi:WD40 repeat protein